MQHAKWGLPTKDIDVFAMGGIKGNDVTKVFLDVYLLPSLRSVPLVTDRVFSPRFARSARAINRREKTRIRNLRYGPRKRG